MATSRKFAQGSAAVSRTHAAHVRNVSLYFAAQRLRPDIAYSRLPLPEHAKLFCWHCSCPNKDWSLQTHIHNSYGGWHLAQGAALPEGQWVEALPCYERRFE